MTLRLIGAVIFGYLCIFALGFAGIAVTWQVLGSEGAFQEGTTVASVPWSAINLLLVGPICAVGGLLASKVAQGRGPLAAKILAGLVLAIGLAVALAGLGAEARPLPEGKEVGDLTFFEAGGVATNPAWYAFSTPFLGALGALAGGRVKMSSDR